MSQTPDRRLDRLVGACFTLLLGALALYGAVQLVTAVWVPLVVVGVVGLVAVTVGWAALRRRGW